MKILFTLIVIFVIAFLLLFIFIYNDNKKETEEEKLNFFMVSFVSMAFAFIITLGISLIIFALLGAVNIVNIMFSFHISKNQLMILAISFFVYLFTLDSMIESIMKYMIGKNILYGTVLMFIRIGIFYLIGKIIGLNETISISIAVGVAFIVLLIESLYHLREKYKEKAMF